MAYAAVADVLKQAMGLDAVSIGTTAIDHAVQARMAACGLADTPAYLDVLHTAPGELQALIETVVVPETWFFRDCEAFTTLARLVREEWLPRHGDGVLRCLSLPCASGEEPYSMAMALLGAGLLAERFAVDAVDISTRLLAHARSAVYGKNAFRGDQLEFRERYFVVAGKGHQLSDGVRQSVVFQQGNVLAPDFLPGEQCYDVIFCRNLLIYFDRATQDYAVQVLRRLLKPQGVLFVGPSETGLMLSHGFASAKVPLAFAFRIAEVAASAALRNTATAMRTKGASILPSPAKPIVSARPHRQSAGTVPGAARSGEQTAAAARVLPEIDMAQASALADQGRLAEAAACCEACMRRDGPLAQGFYLLGLIGDAQGNAAQAAQHYRKALYLDPNHLESLSHLAYLLVRQGDANGAQVLRERMLRAAEKPVH